MIVCLFSARVREIIQRLVLSCRSRELYRQNSSWKSANNMRVHQKLVCVVGKIVQTSVSLGGGILPFSPNSDLIKHQNTICRALSTGELKKNGISQKDVIFERTKIGFFFSANHSRTQKCKREFTSGVATKKRQSTQSADTFGKAVSY